MDTVLQGEDYQDFLVSERLYFPVSHALCAQSQLQGGCYRIQNVGMILLLGKCGSRDQGKCSNHGK